MYNYSFLIIGLHSREKLYRHSARLLVFQLKMFGVSQNEMFRFSANKEYPIA